MKLHKWILSTLLTAAVFPAIADQTTNPDGFFSKFSFKNATIVLQAGAFSATQGTTQQIGIDGLIGDLFTIRHGHGQNGLLGLGYYINGFEKNQVKILYGVNTFYLAPTVVKGDVLQENTFDNLSYQYTINNYPTYLAAKAIINSNNVFNTTFDIGVGPNIIKTSGFSESSLDGDQTLPDNAFAGDSTVTFSATAGVGLQFKNVFRHLPLEISYRYFYLGQGQLSKETDQLLNTLKTGYNHANSITFSTSF